MHTTDTPNPRSISDLLADERMVLSVAKAGALLCLSRAFAARRGSRYAGWDPWPLTSLGTKSAQTKALEPSASGQLEQHRGRLVQYLCAESNY